MRNADCVAFLQWALPYLGLRWPGFRKVRRQVCKRVDRRMRALGLAGTDEYRHYLESHADEWDALASLCTIPISRFYRNRDVFDCLGTNVLPALAGAARARGATCLECWSAGCASGEEAYSLAILWQLTLQKKYPDLDLHVLGTDVDARLIERSRAGVYQGSSLKELPADWCRQAFERRADLYELRPGFRRGVEFEVQDLLETLPPRSFDLILCRNLAFTYFDADRARIALDRLASRLQPGGALAIGAAETLPPDDQFTLWPGCRAVYRIAARSTPSS